MRLLLISFCLAILPGPLLEWLPSAAHDRAGNDRTTIELMALAPELTACELSSERDGSSGALRETIERVSYDALIGKSVIDLQRVDATSEHLSLHALACVLLPVRPDANASLQRYHVRLQV